MILSQYIVDPKTVAEIEILRRTLFFIYDQYAVEETLAMEVLERLWSLEIEELFGDESCIDDARKLANKEGYPTSNKRYDFMGMSIYLLGGYLSNLRENMVGNYTQRSVFYLLCYIALELNVDPLMTRQTTIVNLWFVTYEGVEFHGRVPMKEAEHYVTRVHRDVRKIVRKEMKIK